MPETSCQLRVRYAETGAMGVVYYSTLHVATNENGKPCRLPTKLTELFE